MSYSFTDQQLLAFLEEGLPPEAMSFIESQMRSDPKLNARLVQLMGQREAGVHSVGEIWRRSRLSCPTRQQLGSYLLNALDDEWQDYIRFHLETICCRVCMANVEDLRSEQSRMESQSQEAAAQQKRRQRYFQSSAGYLSRDGKR